MIIKSGRRGGFKQFSNYLQGKAGNEHENEVVNLVSNSMGVNSINDFCILASKIAAPKLKGRHPLKKPIEHIILRTRKGDILTPGAVKAKIPELLEKLGYQDCPWVLVQHVKDGEPHYHLGILRIDSTGKVPNPKSKEVCFEFARKFAKELGFKASYNQADGDRHAQQKDNLARLWNQTQGLSPKERLNRFQKAGFTPVRGDRGQLIFIDRYGKPHTSHRIPALKEQGLKQADFPAAFGLDDKAMAALPNFTTAQRNIRRIHNVKRTTNKAIRTCGPVSRVYKNALPQMRGRPHLGNRGTTAGLTLLTVLRGIPSISQRDELRPVRGAVDRGHNLNPTSQTTPASTRTAEPSSSTPSSPRRKAAWGWWVASRAAAAYKGMIAAGYSSEQAQQASEKVYMEEEQRLQAEQRYLDSLQVPGPKRGEPASKKQSQYTR